MLLYIFMNMVENVSKTLGKSLKTIYNENIIKSVVVLFIILYPGLYNSSPAYIEKIFNYTSFRLLIIFIIAYIICKDVQAALISTGIFIVLMYILSLYKSSKKLKNTKVDLQVSKEVVYSNSCNNLKAKLPYMHESNNKKVHYSVENEIINDTHNQSEQHMMESEHTPQHMMESEHTPQHMMESEHKPQHMMESEHTPQHMMESEHTPQYMMESEHTPQHMMESEHKNHMMETEHIIEFKPYEQNFAEFIPDEKAYIGFEPEEESHLMGFKSEEEIHKMGLISEEEIYNMGLMPEEETNTKKAKKLKSYTHKSNEMIPHKKCARKQKKNPVEKCAMPEIKPVEKCVMVKPIYDDYNVTGYYDNNFAAY